MSTLRSAEGRASGRGTPIASEAAERGVLGALLLHNDPRMTLRLMGRVALVPDSFYWASHGVIFAALASLARKEIGGDEITVNAEMERAGSASESTRELLRILPSYVPAAGNFVEYGEHVVELARWRERQRVAYKMLEAIEGRNEEEWQKAAAVFLPDPPEESEETVPDGPRMLRLVDDAGVVVGERVHCDRCAVLEDQLKGAQKDISAWRTRHANLERKTQDEAQKNAWWLPAQALFEYWKSATGHKNSRWTNDRFYAAEPLLRKYGVEVFARAIAGIANDPYTKMRRNGTVQRYDSWATLCKNADSLEEYANRAPRDWKFDLPIRGGRIEEEERAPRLALVDEEREVS